MAGEVSRSVVAGGSPLAAPGCNLLSACQAGMNARLVAQPLLRPNSDLVGRTPTELNANSHMLAANIVHALESLVISCTMNWASWRCAKCLCPQVRASHARYRMFAYNFVEAIGIENTTITCACFLWIFIVPIAIAALLILPLWGDPKVSQWFARFSKSQSQVF